MDYDRLRELQEKFEENPRRYFAPLANEYRKGGQPKRAIEICRAQLAQMPGHMSGQIVYGQALYEAGEFAEARDVFARALTLDPENLIALRSLGDMSLQSGDTHQAREWYTRLLDADPKDSAVIALVAEIDASAEAVTPVEENIPGVDTDVGDQQIPFITDAHGGPVGEGPPPSPTGHEAAADQAAREPAASAAEEPAPIEATSIPESPSVEAAHAEGAPAEAAAAPESAPPEGLERHYPVETPEPVASPESTAPAQSTEFEQPLGAEGLHSKTEQSEPFGAEGLRAVERETEPVGTEGLSGTAAADEMPEGAEGLKGTPPPAPLAGATGSRSDDEEALDTWTPPPGATVHERTDARKEETVFSGPAPEPFVNETMAQLYLQQGYRQLALRVYYQLAEARPNDQALRDRIAQIEAEDRAAHPETPAPTRPAPSIEQPTPDRGAESEEAPSFDRAPIESPQPSRPSRGRESIESPAREEPRAEPEGIAARQPSIKEFFATLGRRRPPRAAGASGGSARSINNAPPPPADHAIPLGGAVPSATLDAVFAGAQVSPADSRAASRLAGAFSGTAGAPRTTPPTPPMPTPRVNPRVPAAQESEEDVAKFRAWLDGLTGE